MRYQGKLYRALNPVYAREPLSGRGAELYGGRFNPKGTPALYCSFSVLTAIREANQIGNLQPTTLVAYEADIDRIFDGRDGEALAAFDMDSDGLADASWRDQMKTRGQARTQAFARRLLQAGHNGLLVRSYAAGSVAADFNLVLWAWGGKNQAQLTLIDDEGRLSR
ncbi:MAG TPA: RES family NAD+ phosphorylase [Mesorhizobium sp.]|jgi:RES domain-containing protein|uniref:RES family NAD+ phosphorylase n=1 Tax=Mesorhizobium sp. TaxID=1871066 RepID=UPI002DDD9168|nr:RES family NAD+ phosphorylase [Mesorhizobium sp.]HEV2506698.1 RES family NAD+ phosphorylase [Mesorhizobium sp.]